VLTISDRQQYSPAVRNIQDDLNYLGYGCLAEDGHFGPATHDAVTLFQHDQHLRADGEVGDETYSQLTTWAVAGADGCTEPC
jgi:N-acetylmuramoyl-L-alanine amidase